MEQFHLSARDGSGVRIDNFDFNFGGGSSRHQDHEASDNTKKPHALLL